MFNSIKNIIVDNEGNSIKIIHTYSIYDTRKKYVTKETDKYINSIIYNMTQKRLGYIYTDDNTKGHFGEPIVILSFNEQQYPYNNYNAKYGMSQITFGIPIKNKKEEDIIVNTLNSSVFKEIIKATKWNTFYTEWRMFKYISPRFYEKILNKK